MKYTPSALVSEFSGSQGSTVASRNRFGPYFRNRTLPVNPNSATQQIRRNVLKLASQAWRTLTDAQRSAWNEAAALIPLVDSLGRTYYQTGHEYFVSTCQAIRLYDAAGAFPTLPTSIVTPIDPASITPASSAGANTMTVAFTVTPLAALTKLIVEVTPMLSPGVNFVRRSLLQIVFTGAAATVSPANIFAAYTAVFGSLVAGKKVMIRIYAVTSTGGRSGKISVLHTIGA